MRASISASARISRSRQAFGAVAEQPLHLAQRLAALAFGLRHHQVGEAFDRGEIELAVLEGAAGELAGLGRAQALDLAERGERGGDHRAAAVQLQLGGVLAGFAMRRRETTAPAPRR